MNEAVILEKASPRPWYREPWPWILMAGPAVVVVAGFITLWLAVSTQDGLVADDYYKRGLAVNQTLARTDRAKALGLDARVRVESERVSVRLASRVPAPLPERVVVMLSHPTRSGLDQTVVLSDTGRGHEGSIAPLAAGRWQVSIEDEAKTWRLNGWARVPDQGEIRLDAGDKAG